MYIFYKFTKTAFRRKKTGGLCNVKLEYKLKSIYYHINVLQISEHKYNSCPNATLILSQTITVIKITA